MIGHAKKKRTKLGTPPGSLVYIGERKIEKVRFSVMVFNYGAYRLSGRDGHHL